MANSILAHRYAITCLLLLFCQVDWNKEQCQHAEKRISSFDFADDLSEPLLGTASYTGDSAESNLSSEHVSIDRKIDDTDHSSREGNLDEQSNKFSNDEAPNDRVSSNEFNSPV